MTIRTVLVPVRGDGKGENVLDHALAVARPFSAHIDVVHCRPRPEDMLPFGMYVPAALKKQITSSASTLANDEEGRVRALFETYRERHGIETAGHPWPTDRLSISWREETGKMPDVVGRLGRLADLVAVARPDRRANLGFNTLQSALFEAGRLVLVCPPGQPRSVGERVAIGWNGTTEGARAVAASLPLLSLAEKVTILTGDVGEAPVLDAGALRDYLLVHGVEPDIRSFASKESAVGQSLLRLCAEIDADALLIGAYSHSLRRELVLGGVTQHIIETADLPVLMAH